MYEPLLDNGTGAPDSRWCGLFKPKRLASFLGLITLVSILVYMHMPVDQDMYQKIVSGGPSMYDNIRTDGSEIKFTPAENQQDSNDPEVKYLPESSDNVLVQKQDPMDKKETNGSLEVLHKSFQVMNITQSSSTASTETQSYRESTDEMDISTTIQWADQSTEKTEMSAKMQMYEENIEETTISTEIQEYDEDMNENSVWLSANETMLKESVFMNVDFDINSTDVMVFLHIQKTGGTSFGKHLVNDLDLEKQCWKVRGLKRSNCFRPNSDSETWLFSRYSTGWKCGLHAGWTSLSECVHIHFADDYRQRRYFYFTVLRDPVARYLSEYAHVGRGATWKDSYINCNGRKYKQQKCYEGDNWLNVKLDEFMRCEGNWAVNRQTRMLSDLHAINCTGAGMQKEDRDRLMLETAKQNLKNFAYFGLTEEQEKSQRMFEYVFGMRFKVDFVTNNNGTVASELKLRSEQIEKIRRLNKLDLELYDFATKLFHKRWQDLLDRGLVTDHDR